MGDWGAVSHGAWTWLCLESGKGLVACAEKFRSLSLVVSRGMPESALHFKTFALSGRWRIDGREARMRAGRQVMRLPSWTREK